MGQILWIKQDGSMKIEEAVTPPDLKTLQEFVDGAIEHVTVWLGKKRQSMFVNDVGLYREDMAPNAVATGFYWNAGVQQLRQPTDWIVGPAIVLIDIEED